MELWIGAVNLGILYAFMTMGVFITFRIHDFPDITVDGSFTTGAAAAAVAIIAGVNPFLALMAAFAVGAVAGALTAQIHIRFSINGLLSGILMMTALYSVNLHLMGRANIPLLSQTTVFTYIERLNPGFAEYSWLCLVLCAVSLLLWLIVSLFFKTDFGIALRSTGNNPVMAAAAGVNVNAMKTFGVSLANGFVGLSGGLVAQYQGFADISMGIGTIVIGLAAVIVGESILWMPSMYIRVLRVLVGAVVFRLLIAVALYAGMNPVDLKLLTAVFVLLTLIVSKSLGGGALRKRLSGTGNRAKAHRTASAATGTAAIAGILMAGLYITRPATENSSVQKHATIGVVQVSDHGLLNITRDSFVEEMNRLGYRSGENCTILLENANGETPTISSILDKFVQQDVDVVVAISTPCTQTAINKIKDRPVVFATVANPFIIDAGTSDTDHLPNVTGVYGWVPMDRTLELVRQIFNRPIKIGAIWDPSHANSVYNVDLLKKAVEASPDVEFVGTTIAGSSEVYQAAQSLVQKTIDAFVLSPDNIVYSAFESVVKAARSKQIPIFMSDVERLGDGAFGVLGYEYTQSGTQSAHLVDRILTGENPADIPFERYSQLTIGLNLDLAHEYGIAIPDSVRAVATRILSKGKIEDEAKSDTPVATELMPIPNAPRKRLALFLFNENTILVETAKGFTEEIEGRGILRDYNITIDMKNAQNEFTLGQSVAQDIVRQKYDYIVTISTPALQIMAQANKQIPHIFGAVTDPYRMGVANNETDHLPYLTGVATFQPVSQTIAAMREVLPNARRIGIVWNPAEACSEACTLKAREAANVHGFELIERTVSSTGEVIEALRAVLSEKVDIFFTSGDNTVIMALDSIAQILRQNHIPYFTNAPSDVDRGAMVGIGADYVEVGRETARTAIRVIKGEETQSIPINNFVPIKTFINLKSARELGIQIPEEFVKQATEVRDAA